MQRNALCRFRRELSKAYCEYYFLAKVGFDTAVNKPCKVCPLSAYRSPYYYRPPRYLWLELLALRDLLRWTEAGEKAEGVRERLRGVAERMVASPEELAGVLGEGVL